jgi:uncharacterized membrane protein YfcA
MLKIIFTVIVIYVAYKFFFGPSTNLKSAQKQPPVQEKKENKKGDFIDYEEVE